ncbi:MAG: metallophosphoesterase [Pseudomonadota bacterium]|nr:metallophosphoesterase [Pseudomonadota bacterium]
MRTQKTAATGTLLIASDIHGNTSQYDKLFSYALNHNCSGIVLGGDLMPKGLLFSPARQRDFINNYLFARMDSLHRQRGKPLPIFLMMGNDDLKTNEQLLIDNQARHHFTYIHNRIIGFGKYFIAGYSFVPPTPHKCKDWEKPDGARLRAQRGAFREDGWLSLGDERMPCLIGDLPGIAQDLEEMFKGFTHFDKTLFISHAPPYGTHLDMVKRDSQHVGSMAVREFLARHRPLLSVHGHIHETVLVSGEWQDRIHDGAGPAIAIGNDHRDASPFAVVVTFSKHGPNIQRLRITDPQRALRADGGVTSLLMSTTRSARSLRRRIAEKIGEATAMLRIYSTKKKAAEIGQVAPLLKKLYAR